MAFGMSSNTSAFGTGSPRRRAMYARAPSERAVVAGSSASSPRARIARTAARRTRGAGRDAIAKGDRQSSVVLVVVFVVGLLFSPARRVIDRIRQRDAHPPLDRVSNFLLGARESLGQPVVEHAILHARVAPHEG